MERYTQFSQDRWQVPQGLEQAALDRLARFEDAYEQLCLRREGLDTQMQPLRVAGKQKSARFRELLGEKLMLQQMFLLLEAHGLT